MTSRKDQCCGNCNASMPDSAKPDTVYCRAQPPQVVLLTINHPISGVPGQQVFHSQFPSMNEQLGWCREWAAKDLDS